MARKLAAPVVNQESEVFWKGAREGRLLVPFCSACGKAH